MKVNTRFFQTNKMNPVIGKIMMGLFILTGLFVHAQTPVAYYPFNGNANDAVGSNNGTVNGATLTTGQFGNSVLLNGSNDNIDLGTSFIQQDFTIEMWLKPGATQVTYADIIDNNHSGSFTNWACQQDQNNVNIYGFFVNNTSASFTLQPNVWQHLTLVKGPTTLEVFINGILIQSTPYNGGPVNYSGNFLRLGRWGAGGRNWNGSMDEVRFWNVVRTQAEIVANMNNQLSGTETGLVGYWDMNRSGQGAGLTVENKATLTGSALDGTTVGTASTPVFASDGLYRSITSGDWSSPSTWEMFDGTSFVPATNAPSDADGVITIRNEHNVTVNSPVTVDQVVVEAGGTLTQNAAITLNDGIGNDLSVGGTWIWNGNSLAGTGDVVIASGGLLNIATGGEKTLGVPISSNGTIDWQDGLFRSSVAGLTFTNNGIFTISGNNGTDQVNGTGSINFINNGTLTKTSNGGTGFNHFSLTNPGTLNVNSGSLLFANGTINNSSPISLTNATIAVNEGLTFNWNAGSAITGSGVLSFNHSGSALVLNINMVIPSTISLVLASNVTGAGNLTCNGALTLDSYYIEINGPGTLAINENSTWNAARLNRVTTVANGKTLTMAGGSDKWLGANLINNGTIDWQDGSFRFTAAGVTCTNAGLFNISGNNGTDQINGTGNLNFINSGTLRKTSTGTTSFNHFSCTNNGTIQGLGTYNFMSNPITGTGSIAPGLSPGILTMNGQQPLSANSTLEIEILDGGGAGSGHDQLQRNGDLTLAGTLTVTETGIVPNGVFTIINLTSGTISGSFANANLPLGYTLQVNATTVTVTRSLAVEANYRSIASGNWSSPSTWEVFDGTSFVPATNAPSSVDGVITIRIGHNVTVNNAVTVDQVVVESEGSLTQIFSLILADGPGNDLTVNGTWTWQGGETSGPGNAQIGSGGTLNFTTVGNKFVSANITSNGTLDWQDGNILFSNNPTITNNGTWIISGDNTLSTFISSGTIVNSGTISKVSTGITSIQTASFTNNTGATIKGLGTYNLNATAFVNNGVIAPGSSPGYLTLNGNQPLTSNSTLEIEIMDGSGPGTGHDQMVRNGNLDLAGTLTIQASTFTPDPGTQFVIIDATSISGTFSTVNIPADWTLYYDFPSNGKVLLSFGTLQTYFQDADNDTYGNPLVSQLAATQPSGYVLDNADCNDTDPLQRPGQVWYTDMDNDGYVSSNGPGQPALTITQCSRPAGGKAAVELISTVGRDCDDNDPTINPLAQRLTISSDPDFANGVYPLLGDPSTTFFFEALYFDDNNALPSVTFPRAYLDFESNNFINEPQDRIVILSEFDAADQNTADGKKYVGSISGLPNGNTWQTFLISEYSNTCQRGTGPFPHPDVLLQPNVQIFANDIEFSDENPPVSSPITITANVGNPSDFAVQNVVVHLQNQAEPSTVYPDITIPYIAAHTSGVATWDITTPSFNGLCPMQVTVDYTNTIAEPNELDNVAIALFNNGSVQVTGDIIVEADVTPVTSYASANNTLHLAFDATSFSNNAPVPPGLQVSGALVTFQIDETGATYTGFTGANGSIYIPFTAPVSPGVYHISGTVSSPPFTGFINPNITTFELINGNDPDYTVTLTASGVNCLAGQSVEQTMVITNNGLVASTVNTQLTLSIPGGNPSLLTFVVPPISAGGSYTIPDVNVQFPTAGTYIVCAQADALQEINELNESNNSSCLNIFVAFADPDLEVINGSSGPKSICNPISLSVLIRNSGGVSSAASTSRMVVKSGNTTIHTFNHPVPALGPSDNYSYTETFIPASVGIYTYTVEADINQVVAEANESNNINSFTITVTPCLPDLVAGNCDLSATSATGYTSGNMTLNATIRNLGAVAATAPVSVRFQFSNNTFVDVIHTGGIPKDQSVNVTATTPAFVNPGVTMKAIVDPNNTIAEMNEANNESFSKPTAWDLAFTSSVEGCGPDLTNYSYRPFFSYYLPVKIANYSLYTAANVKVKYQISGPGLIGTVTIATAEAVDVITNCVVCPQGVSLPSPFVFPQTGTYTLTLTIDPDNEYAEVNESNNVRVVSIEVDNKPDMRIVSSFINPTLLNPGIGEPITVSVTYDNTGSSNVSDLMQMKLFIDNVVIETVSGLSGLATNNYATVNFTIPWSSTVPGTHVIKAFIDSDNGIIENDEDNNIATRALTVGSSANLWVKSLSVLNYYPNLNDNITIKTKIENQGDLPTNALVSVFYVNNSLDSVLINAQSVSLPGNDSISLNIPWVVVDNKTKIVVVISNSTALEYNYTDNTAFIELGKMALFTEAFPACEAGDQGTMTAYINGGDPPYTYAWSNGSATKSITAAAAAYSVTVFDATGQQVSGSDIIPPCTGMLLKVKCFLQGYYIAQNLMASVLTQSGIISPLEYTDTITVRLHATTPGFPMVASCNAILHSNGTITCEFPAGVLGSSRYIVLEHRNSIETWSAAPVLISNNMMYDFSNAVNKAYGNNLQLMLGGAYAVYGGDVNQDGGVDTADMTPVDNDAANYVAGYLPTDVNGDGVIDTADMTIVDNNGANYVTVVTP